MIKAEMLRIIEYFYDKFGNADNVYYPSVFAKLSKYPILNSKVEECLDGLVEEEILIKGVDLMCGYCQSKVGKMYGDVDYDIDIYCENCDRVLVKDDIYKKSYYKLP